jgi:hypothetical protein
MIEEEAQDTAARPRRGFGRARKSDVADGKDAA